jgi:B12-binding domain/radical SAM domain protein
MSGDLSTVYDRMIGLPSLFNDKKIVWLAGGSYPTGEPIGTLKMGFDIIILGEGEKVFPELVYRLINRLAYDDLNGIAYRESEKKCTVKPSKEQVDINDYPPFAVQHRIFAPIEISRGCPWTCKFCQTPRIFGFMMRHRTCDNIIRYVNIATQYQYSNMWFISPNAFAYGSRDGKEVCPSKIKQLLTSVRNVQGIDKIFFGTFPSEVRPESVKSEILDSVTNYASNTTLTIGAQSGSERILKSTGRGHTIEDIHNAVDLTMNYGLVPYLDFMFGLPGETLEDVEKTKEVILECVKKGAKIHAHAFIPLPGTPYQNEEHKPLDITLRRWLSDLARSGKLDGFWSRHERIAEETCRYRKALNY